MKVVHCQQHPEKYLHGFDQNLPLTVFIPCSCVITRITLLLLKVAIARVVPSNFYTDAVGYHALRFLHVKSVASVLMTSVIILSICVSISVYR